MLPSVSTTVHEVSCNVTPHNNTVYYLMVSVDTVETAFIGSSILNQIVFKVPSENSLYELPVTADLIESLLWSQSPTNEKNALEAEMKMMPN